MTAKLREMEDEQSQLSRLNRFKVVIIRVQFPNRFVLQGKFTPFETIETVMDFVRPYLLESVDAFYLCKTFLAIFDLLPIFDCEYEIFLFRSLCKYEILIQFPHFISFFFQSLLHRRLCLPKNCVYSKRTAFRRQFYISAVIKGFRTTSKKKF